MESIPTDCGLTDEGLLGRLSSNLACSRPLDGADPVRRAAARRQPAANPVTLEQALSVL